jgi:hypothetical protein
MPAILTRIRPSTATAFLSFFCYCSACFIASHIHVDISIFIPQREREKNEKHNGRGRQCFDEAMNDDSRVGINSRLGWDIFYGQELLCANAAWDVMLRSIFRTPQMFAIRIMFAFAETT